MISASQKQMDDYRAKQMSKNRARDHENQRLLEEAMKKKVDINNISNILLMRVPIYSRFRWNIVRMFRSDIFKITVHCK